MDEIWHITVAKIPCCKLLIKFWAGNITYVINIVTLWVTSRHRPTHRLHNPAPYYLCHIDCAISAETVTRNHRHQCTNQCRPWINNKRFNIGVFIPYMIYDTWFVVLWHDTALSFASCFISHLITPLVP